MAALTVPLAATTSTSWVWKVKSTPGLGQQLVADPLEDFGADAVAIGREGAASGLEPVKDVAPDPAGKEVDTIAELHEGRNHASGAHAAQAGMRLDQPDFAPLPRGGHRRRDASGSAAGDEDVGFVTNGKLAAVGKRGGHGRLRCSVFSVQCFLQRRIRCSTFTITRSRLPPA